MGYGKFKTKSMSDNDILNKLIEADTKQIKKSLKNGDTTESVVYNF